ncbi:beta-propeller fold lactonase family protein [Sorangium sp. So ce295]|uniref:lactonase family protein n=1 Tax=Sorangium sp. So ce295 TaxID=3133295 RepID=UPI003F63814C
MNNAANNDRRAVYVMTNATPNAIQVFHRAGDGTLSPGASYPTGGNGHAPNPPLGFPILESQSALVLSRDGRMLFAVNAGSDTISSFVVRRGGELQRVGLVSSSGARPVSLALHEGVLYVANADSKSIQGYRVGHTGELTMLAGASRSLSGSGVATIAFNRTGDVLVIASRGDGEPMGSLETVTVDDHGMPGPVRRQDVVKAGQAPFGFTFDRRGHVILSNLSLTGDSSVSRYSVAPTGEMRLIAEQRIFTTAACWVATATAGPSTFAFITSAGSRSVTALRVDRSGSLTPVGPLSATEQAAFTSGLALDCAVSMGGDFLYVLSPDGFSVPPFTGAGPAVVHGYRIEPSGALTSLGPPVGRLPQGATGLAAV